MKRCCALLKKISAMCCHALEKWVKYSIAVFYFSYPKRMTLRHDFMRSQCLPLRLCMATFTDNLSCLGLEINLINRKMKKPNIDDYPLMKDGKLQYYDNDLAKYIAFLEAENEQLRLCGVGSSYVVFEDGKNQGVDGLVQLSISLPTIEGARNYAKSWKNKKLRIYKLIE